jgi:hypothetical protein
MAAGYSIRVYGHVGARTRAADARWYCFYLLKGPLTIYWLALSCKGCWSRGREGRALSLASDGLHIHASATFVPPGIRRRDYVSTQLAGGPLTQCLTSSPFKFTRISRLLRARVSARSAIGNPGKRKSWDSTFYWAIGGQRDTKHCASLCLAPSRAAIYTRRIAHVRPESHSTVRAWVEGEAILAHDPTSNPCRRVEIGNSLSDCDVDASTKW